MDLAMLTVIKLAVLAVIYYACFAAYDGRKLDTASHLLGPLSSLNAPASTGLNRGL